ncbi:MAG: hypothetical protein WC477_02200 [Patescibacteria group bacterium]
MFDNTPPNLPIEPETASAPTPAVPPPVQPKSSTPTPMSVASTPMSVGTNAMRGGIVPSVAQEPEDILSAEDAHSAPQGTVAPSIADSAPNRRSPIKKAILILSIVAGVLLLAAGGIFIAKRFFSSSKTSSTGFEAVPSATEPSSLNQNQGANQQPAEQQPTPAPSEQQQPVESPPVVPATPPAAVPTPVPIQTIDSDGDGLSDADEVQLGTDPHSADTDGDGLSDGDEVHLWHTDPLKADTDGDGYSDGAEVQNGYNPLGPGKLPAIQ